VLRRICVYCGSSAGGDTAYQRAAEALADSLVDNRIELVYGGSHKGIMGILADAVLARGGSVQGVIPRMLEEKEIAHTGLTELHVVNSMHERKSMMAALSDGFIALPGGFGTLEELIEILTWGQLRFHIKPCGVLNVNGYFNKLLEFLDTMQEQQFLKPENRAMLLADATPSGLLAQFESYVPPDRDKWL
jgi:uncharacterized protein (TIGR00730 family)